MIMEKNNAQLENAPTPTPMVDERFITQKNKNKQQKKNPPSFN
jgi:hypothetical protein